MDVIFVIGRVLFSLVFVMSGMAHFQQREGMTQLAQSRGAPAAELMVPLTGIAIILSGIAVALGLWADLAGLVLAAFLFSTAFIIHAFWTESDPEAQMNEMVHFLKDLALAGAALVIFYLYEQSVDVPASLNDGLF